MTTHRFAPRLAEGQLGEQVLDSLMRGDLVPTQATARTPFGRTFLRNWRAGLALREASDQEQRLGIDRFISGLPIEYKTDVAAGSTGNAFVETVSVDTAGKLGWSYTATAHLLVYYVPDHAAVYLLRFSLLREALPAWARVYPRRRVKNPTYHAEGLLVPLAAIDALSDVVITL